MLRIFGRTTLDIQFIDTSPDLPVRLFAVHYSILFAVRWNGGTQPRLDR
jgi:hypothetical protein